MTRTLPALTLAGLLAVGVGAWVSRDIPQPSPSVTVHEWDWREALTVLSNDRSGNGTIDDVPAIEPGTVLHLQMVPDGDHRERCAMFGGVLVVTGYICRNVRTSTPDKEAS